MIFTSETLCYSYLLNSIFTTNNDIFIILRYIKIVHSCTCILLGEKGYKHMYHITLTHAITYTCTYTVQYLLIYVHVHILLHVHILYLLIYVHTLLHVHILYHVHTLLHVHVVLWAPNCTYMYMYMHLYIQTQ